MMTTRQSIDPKTRLGAVHLAVAHLERQLDYYQRLGLQIHDRAGDRVHLGVGAENLLVLDHQPQRQSGRGKAGLYHFAILVPSRTHLGRTLRHLIDNRIAVGGASDHAVSEALYLTDPEGNGIEIYRDRPHREWVYPNGTLRMVTEPLDVDGVLAAAEDASAWDGFPAGTVMGHIHLQVGDLAAEERFYQEVIGFDLVTKYGAQATFLSAGGYHHHLGMNTWAGRLAPRSGHELGLTRFTVVLPDATALTAVRQRLDATDTAYQTEEQGLLVSDPQGIRLFLTTDSH